MSFLAAIQDALPGTAAKHLTRRQNTFRPETSKDAKQFNQEKFSARTSDQPGSMNVQCVNRA